MFIPVAHAEKVAEPKTIEANYAEFDRQAGMKLTPSQASLLKKIGGCESGFQMKPNASGSSSAFGIFQLLKVHDARARKLGYPDRLSLEANVAVAIDLFLEQGTTPWSESKYCWSK